MANKFLDKFDKQVNTFGPKEIMYAVGFVVLAVILYFTFFHVDKTPYGYEDISENLATYLADKDSYYDEEYKDGKMLVLYTVKRDPLYKYPKNFQDALDAAMENETLNELYNFKSLTVLRNNILFDGEKGEKIIKGEKELRKACRSFCVINPKKKALYFYFEPKERDAQYLQENLKKLEFWGAKLD